LLQQTASFGLNQRGKQRARVKPRHIPNRSAGRAAYLAFLFGDKSMIGYGLPLLQQPCDHVGD
jgi:hypothetical protein